MVAVAKWMWFVIAGAAVGLAAFFVFSRKTDREKILEKARQAKAERAAAEGETEQPDPANGEG